MRVYWLLLAVFPFPVTGTSIVDLGTLGGARSEAYAINNSGQVTGYAHLANNANRAFLYSGGAMIDLGSPGGGNSYAYAVSGLGLAALSDSGWRGHRLGTRRNDLAPALPSRYIGSRLTIPTRNGGFPRSLSSIS